MNKSFLPLSFTRKMTTEQELECAALIEELGLVPASLVTPSVVEAFHRKLSDDRKNICLDSINAELEREFMKECVQRSHYRKNSKVLKEIRKEYDDLCVLPL